MATLSIVLFSSNFTWGNFFIKILFMRFPSCIYYNFKLKTKKKSIEFDLYPDSVKNQLKMHCILLKNEYWNLN